MTHKITTTGNGRSRLGRGYRYKGTDYIHHGRLAVDESAFFRLNLIQVLVLGFVIGLVVILFIVNWRAALTATVGLLTALYAGDLLFNLFIIARTVRRPSDIGVSDAQLSSLRVSSLPTYTILCPLYKEGRVLGQFIEAIGAMNYPASKLQVLLLLEADDDDTRDRALAMDLPDYVTVVTVPPSLPKTKPKACNYGLTLARGKYVVIYDAEDVPDPLQLKKAVVTFRQLGDRVACIQCKLNFYNPHTNLLTRAFTSEYALWFGLVLPGLQSVNAPIPLGGTSNHFRSDVLRRIGGWDAFNVTEDADLGMRLVKNGYRTAIVDSMTLEEANARPKSWFWQRTRWIKGYYQTYIVHTRLTRRARDAASWRPLDRILFQTVIGGKMLSILINPVMWLLTLGYLVFHAAIGPVVQQFYPAPVLYAAVTSLIFGNFLYIYYYMLGAAQRGDYRLVKYAFLSPVYWLFMSLAAYYALYELIRTPHKWRKTAHGLHLKTQAEGAA